MGNLLQARGPAAREGSELLALLERRWNAFLKDMPDRYRRSRGEIRHLERAVQLHAEVEASDPFAANRMRLHITQGYEDAHTVAAVSTRRLQARANGLVL